MTASPEMQPCDISGINVILRRDGTMVALSAIKTVEEGNAILADLEGTILAIEDQIAHMDCTTPNGQEWRKRAERALKVKRRQHPRLQQRIGELRRAARQVPAGIKLTRDRPEAQEKRIAFIDAAEAMLDHELFVEIWERAKRMRPEVFSDQGSVS